MALLRLSSFERNGLVPQRWQTELTLHVMWWLTSTRDQPTPQEAQEGTLPAHGDQPAQQRLGSRPHNDPEDELPAHGSNQRISPQIGRIPPQTLHMPFKQPPHMGVVEAAEGPHDRAAPASPGMLVRRVGVVGVVRMLVMAPVSPGPFNDRPLHRHRAQNRQ